MNEAALTPAQYSIEPGVITINAAAFPAEGSYIITVEAEGYVPAAVTQVILAGGSNLVVNGSFTSGTAGWNTWSGEGGAAVLSVTDGAANIDIGAAGSQLWPTSYSRKVSSCRPVKPMSLASKPNRRCRGR